MSEKGRAEHVTPPAESPISLARRLRKIAVLSVAEFVNGALWNVPDAASGYRLSAAWKFRFLETAVQLTARGAGFITGLVFGVPAITSGSTTMIVSSVSPFFLLGLGAIPSMMQAAKDDTQRKKAAS